MATTEKRIENLQKQLSIEVDAALKLMKERDNWKRASTDESARAESLQRQLDTAREDHQESARHVSELIERLNVERRRYFSLETDMITRLNAMNAGTIEAERDAALADAEAWKGLRLDELNAHEQTANTLEQTRADLQTAREALKYERERNQCEAERLSGAAKQARIETEDATLNRREAEREAAHWKSEAERYQTNAHTLREQLNIQTLNLEAERNESRRKAS